MNAVLENIYTRRSVRSYKPDPVPEELLEVVRLLPPSTFTRQRLCDQLNSSIGGHAWGQVYGTVE